MRVHGTTLEVYQETTKIRNQKVTDGYDCCTETHVCTHLHTAVR